MERTQATLSGEQLHRALDGDADAIAQLVSVLSPIVQARVARVLLRRRPTMDIRQEVADYTQEVFVALLLEDGRLLRAWDPERGLSLLNFVGLIAERRVITMLRSRGRHLSLEDELQHSDDEGALSSHAPSAESGVMSRLLLEQLLESLQASLSARGLELFHRLYVQEQSVPEICAQTGLSAAAVHQWRHRLRDAANQALLALQCSHEETRTSDAGAPHVHRMLATSRQRGGIS